MSFSDNKGLRTAVLVSALLISISSIIGTIYSTVYGVRYNAKEIMRVEKKVDGSYAEEKIINKEFESKIQEVRDRVLVDETYQKKVDSNFESLKTLTRDLGEIKGDIKVLINRP